MKLPASWKTTLFGLISAGAAFVEFAQQMGITFPKGIVAVSAFILVGGLAGLGIVAKDSQVTGGTIQQPNAMPPTPQRPPVR